MTESLDKKKILVVDDEPDVLETIAEVLEMCHIDTAADFHKAEHLLKTKSYDMVILDIMGVKGLHLIDVAVQRNVLAVMLTAPAFNPEYLMKSRERGAISCFPKEDIAELDSLLTELYQVIEDGGQPWNYTMQRIEPLLDERFPPGWKSRYKELWDTAAKDPDET
ncbi:MAG: response regulator [Deltaproteobacteria bacterium]